MDNNFGLSKEQLDALLATVGQKAGIAPAKLKEQLMSGSFDSIVNRLGNNKSADINKVLTDPKALDQLLNSPQAKDILRKMMGGK